jgi:hypothetical protein
MSVVSSSEKRNIKASKASRAAKHAKTIASQSLLNICDIEARNDLLTGSHYLPDSVLLTRFSGSPFTQVRLFSCNLSAFLTNVIPVKNNEVYTNMIRDAFIATEEANETINDDECVDDEMNFPVPRRVEECGGSVVCVNSNFGHFTTYGYEAFIKFPRTQVGTSVVRKKQGDGTCFNSEVEPTIKLSKAQAGGKKDIYLTKFFPTTGNMQIPGSISPTLSDGIEVARVWTEFITRHGLVADPTVPVEIERICCVSMNFKFRLRRRCDRTIVDFDSIYEYLLDGQTNNTLPYPITLLKKSGEESKLSFKIQPSTHPTAVNIFLTGKIDILGAKLSINVADILDNGSVVVPGKKCDINDIHEFLTNMFNEHWEDMVCLVPLIDSEADKNLKGSWHVEHTVTDDDFHNYMHSLFRDCVLQSSAPPDH